MQNATCFPIKADHIPFLNTQADTWHLRTVISGYHLLIEQPQMEAPDFWNYNSAHNFFFFWISKKNLIKVGFKEAPPIYKVKIYKPNFK